MDMGQSTYVACEVVASAGIVLDFSIVYTRFLFALAASGSVQGLANS